MTTFVQQSNANGLFPNPIGSGNTVVFFGYAYNGGAAISTNTPTINGVNVTGTKAQEGNSPLPNSALVYEGIWLLPNITTGGTQLGLTFTGAGATEQTLIGVEFAGLGASPVVFGTPSTGNGNNSGPASSGSTGPSTNSSVVAVGASVGYALSMSAPSSPWNGIIGNSGFAYAGYQIPGTSGSSYTFSTAFSGSGDWVAGVALIQPAGSAGHTSSASLAVTPSLSSGRVRGRHRSPSGSVALSLASGRSQGHHRGASRSLTPTLHAVGGNNEARVGRAVSLITPVFTTVHHKVHTNHPVMSVIPVLRASGRALPGTSGITKTTAISSNAYNTMMSELTIECEAGAPYQGGMRQLALDRWNYMYPSN